MICIEIIYSYIYIYHYIISIYTHGWSTPLFVRSSHQGALPSREHLPCPGFLPLQLTIFEAWVSIEVPLSWMVDISIGKKLGNTRPGKHTTRRRMARERRGAESSVVRVVYGDTILQDNMIKMYYRQTRRVVSRQYMTSTRQ